MKKVVFIKNAVILFATSLILRVAGIVFKVWLGRAIGSEGVGLYQLVLSVYVFVSAFAGGGICTAVTRLVTNSLAINSKNGAVSVLKKGIFLCLFISLFTLSITFFGADFIAKRILSDARATSAIKILGFSIPFMSISACLRGYFLARRKTLSPALAQIIEQAVRIILVLYLAGGFAKKGISFAVAAVMVGDAVAEAVSCFILYLSYQTDKCKVANGGNTPKNQGFREILRIATPITAGRYLNSGLRTAENILVPKSLAVFGASSALSQFGMIKGMALPLLFFPSSFLTAISTLLVPEMSEAATKKQDYKIRFASERTITITSEASFLIGALFFALSKPLGMLFYESYEVSYLLRALAPIVPLMYIDSICDGMLKGLDKQSFIFWLSVSDSAARLVAVPLVVSRFGMTGFLSIMVISNLYTASLRVWKLLSTAKTSFNIGKWLMKPLISAVLCAVTASFIYNSLPFSAVVSVIVSILLSSGVYIGLLFLLGGITREDISIF